LGAKLQQLQARVDALEGENARLTQENDSLRQAPPSPAATGPAAGQPTTDAECVARWGEAFVQKYGAEFLIEFCKGLGPAVPANIEEVVERKLQATREADEQKSRLADFWRQVDGLEPRAPTINAERMSNGFYELLKALRPGTAETWFEYLQGRIAAEDHGSVADVFKQFADGRLTGAGPQATPPATPPAAPPPPETFATPGGTPPATPPTTGKVSLKECQQWFEWAANNRGRVTQREISAKQEELDKARREGRLTD